MPDAAAAVDPWRLAVVVPARDEAELLPRCLRSIVTACGHVPHATVVHVVVVADACRDHAERAAVGALAGVNASIVRSTSGSAGHVRQLGVEAA